MGITLFLAAIVSAVLGTLLQRARWRNEMRQGIINDLHSVNEALTDKFITLEEQAEVRNTLLDYLFRAYYLNKPDPYLLLPGYEEKRCYHCFHPEYAGHDPTCIWQHCRPFTEVLYAPAPTVPDDAPDVPDGNTMLPVEPEPELPLHPAVDGYGHGV
jgi:hypothetical protein